MFSTFETVGNLIVRSKLTVSFNPEIQKRDEDKASINLFVKIMLGTFFPKIRMENFVSCIYDMHVCVMALLAMLTLLSGPLLAYPPPFPFKS